MSYNQNDLLRKAVQLLQEAHDAAKTMIEKDLPGINPYMVKDVNGRYILMEGLTEIVRARAVLAELEKR